MGADFHPPSDRGPLLECGCARWCRDWSASTWIGGFTSLRTEFHLTNEPAAVAAASLYISGVGCFQAFLNGQPVSDSVLDPGFSTPYTHRVLYRAFAVERSLVAQNAIGVRLGFCKYGYMEEYCVPATSPAASDASCRGLNLQLRIACECDTTAPPCRACVCAKQHILPQRTPPWWVRRHEIAVGVFSLVNFGFLERADKDGSSQLVSTANVGGWEGTTAHNPVTYTHIYHGEKRDDRLWQPGWSSPGFATGTPGYRSVWRPASRWLHASTLGTLTLHAMPSIGPSSSLLPLSKTALEPEVDGESRWLFDFVSGMTDGPTTASMH